MSTPRQVFERLSAGIGSGDWSRPHLPHAEDAGPELIVAAFDYETRGTRLANIQVLRVRDGLIVESRDYHHHAAITEAMA